MGNNDVLNLVKNDNIDKALISRFLFFWTIIKLLWPLNYFFFPFHMMNTGFCAIKLPHNEKPHWRLIFTIQPSFFLLDSRNHKVICCTCIENVYSNDTDILKAILVFTGKKKLIFKYCHTLYSFTHIFSMI